MKADFYMLLLILLLPSSVFAAEMLWKYLPGGDTLKRASQDSTASETCGSGCTGNTKFLLNFDSRQSFVFNRLVKMNGLKIGLEIYENYRFGLGFYELDAPVTLKPKITEHDTISYSVGFSYSTLFFEYVIFQNYKWEISAPVSIGSGTASINAHIHSSNWDTTAHTPKIPLMSLNVAAHYKLVHWLGIGAGLGYRQMLVGDKTVNNALSAPFYVIKVKIFVGEVYKGIFKREQVKEEKARWQNRDRKRE